MKNIKIIILFLIIFAMANTIIFYLTELNKEQSAKVVLDDSLKNLQANYEILLKNQKLTADSAYTTTTELTRGFTKIIKKAQNASSQKKEVLRTLLYKLLKKKYELLQQKGVLQYAFYLPNNEAFLRMHDVESFGDNVASIREDVKLVNATQKPMKGFYQGKATQSFRNVYPIFDGKGKHLGAMEISFSSNSLQTYLNAETKTHSYFLVKKDIFDAAQWQRNKVALDYIENAENGELLLTLNKSHSKKKCILENEMKLASVRAKVNDALQKSQKFAVQALNGTDHVEIVAFYPIINQGDSSASAWIASHSDSDFIFETEKNMFIIRALSFVTFLILVVLFYKLINAKQIVEREHRLVNDVLNSSEDIIFATNFKEVNFSNKNFLRFFDIKNQRKFTQKVKNDVVSIFMPSTGSLHAGLLRDKETFVELVERTPKDERIVTVLDDSLVAKEFKIALSKASYSEKGVYLITLSDLIRIKEQEKTIQKKAYIDSLTGLFNKNKFDEVVESELKRDARHKRDFGITLLNIDDFEQINEMHGNLIADAVIMQLAQTIKSNLRETDILARFSDGKFAVAFLDTSKDDVEVACRKLKDNIEGLSHPIVGNIKVNFSTAQYLETDTLESMYNRCKEVSKKMNDSLPQLNVIK